MPESPYLSPGSADNHLLRLLAPQSAETPWFRSLYANLRDFIRPEELPPLDLTSRPIPVKDIWGLYRSDPTPRVISAAFHLAAFGLLMFVFTSRPVQQAMKQSVDLIDPVLRPWLPQRALSDRSEGGGGGGDRAITPVSKGQLPRPAKRQFVPPTILTNEHPKLTVEASLLNAPENLQNTAPSWGDPLAKLGVASNGIGAGGGTGSGTGGGVGPGGGPGFGDGVFHAGGGVSAPAVIFQVPPEYSEEARRAKYSGTVTLSIVVDTEGRVRNIRVARSLGLGLDEKAIEAVQKWRFRPGRKDGHPVSVQADVLVNFRLL